LYIIYRFLQIFPQSYAATNSRFIKIYCLREQEYEKVNNSELLPKLDLSLLNRCLLLSSPLEAIKQFRQGLTL